jgi:hypothetical protein
MPFSVMFTRDFWRGRIKDAEQGAHHQHNAYIYIKDAPFSLDRKGLK